MDTCQSGPHRLQRKRVEIGRSLTETFACASKALEDIRFAEEQAQRDFRRAEPAKRLQSQDQSGIPRDRLVATNEKHSQQIVANLSIKSRGRRIIGRYGPFTCGGFEYPQPSGILAQSSKQIVVRDAVKPDFGLVGYA